MNAATTAQKIAPSGLMTTEQAAEYLAVKPATLQVWRSTNRKKLTYVKVGGQVRYRRQDLDAFITENLHGSSDR
jgi:excisionase family DNA binding protein